MENIWILAQGVEEPTGITAESVTEQETSTTVATDPNAVPATRPRQPGFSPLILLGVMCVIMYLLLFRGPQKQKQQRRQLIQSLKKNDRVLTAGGIIGTIVDIKDDEVVLKVDEANNTKVRILPGAISKNISEEKS